MEKDLVIFDEVFHSSTGTIDGLVNERGLATFKIGDDKAEILFSRLGDFCFVDDASR